MNLQNTEFISIHQMNINPAYTFVTDTVVPVMTIKVSTIYKWLLDFATIIYSFTTNFVTEFSNEIIEIKQAIYTSINNMTYEQAMIIFILGLLMIDKFMFMYMYHKSLTIKLRNMELKMKYIAKIMNFDKKNELKMK